MLYRKLLDLTCSVIWLAGVAIKAEQFYKILVISCMYVEGGGEGGGGGDEEG